MLEDELVIQSLNEYKTMTHGDMENGYYIKEKKYCFREEVLFDGKMKMMLPEVFQDMPEDLKHLKYPNEQRPQIIKTNLDEGMDFAFNMLDYPNGERNIKTLTEFFQRTIKNLNPANHFYDLKVEEKDGYTLGYFDFRSFAVDGKLYNYIYFIDFPDKLLHGVFNCYVQDMENWKPVIEDVVNSITIL